MSIIFYIIVLINALLFLGLSGLHGYWALGGRWAANAVIPSQKDGKASFQPSPMATWIVAIGLLGFAALMFLNAPFLATFPYDSYLRYTNGFIMVLFGVRAIGDFTYVGFFKRVKGSVFAKNDTLYYSPLCLWLSLSTAVLIFG